MNKKLLNSILYFLNQLFDIKGVSYSISKNFIKHTVYFELSIIIWSDDGLSIKRSMYRTIRCAEDFNDNLKKEVKEFINQYVETINN